MSAINAIRTQKEQLKQNPVQVDISKEGMEQYRNTIQQSDPVDEELHIIHPQMSYEMELSSKMNQINSSKTNNTVEDRANSMVEAYASLYAEIVRGYEDGTRVRYAQSGEDRVLTKEEDLAELDATYKNQTESFENLFHLEQESQSRLESSIRNTAWGQKSSKASAYLAERDKKKENPEYIPDNIAERIMKAQKSFVSQFQINQDSKK